MRPIPRRHRGNGSGAAPARHAAGQRSQGPRHARAPRLRSHCAWVDDDVVILAAGALLAAGLGASLLAGRLRVPALVLFLGVGMALGSDAVGLISFSDYELARFLGTTALAMILFEGGLAAGWRVIRPVLAPALSLALVGTLVTAIVTGLAAAWLLDLSTLEGLLLGSILSATDGAAIFAVLRGSTLRRRLAHVLEGEAGFNDPVAVLLVVGFIEWIQTRLRHRGHGAAVRRGDGDRRGRGPDLRPPGRRGRCAAWSSRARASTRCSRSRRRAGVRRRRRGTARASSPSTSRVSRSATRSSRPSARSSRSTRGSRGSRRSGCS